MARIFGIRLLTLDATVVLAPAAVSAPVAAGRPSAAASVLSPGVPGTRPAPVGRGLAEAVRTLEAGAEILADARRGSARRGG